MAHKSHLSVPRTARLTARSTATANLIVDANQVAIDDYRVPGPLLLESCLLNGVYGAEQGGNRYESDCTGAAVEIEMTEVQVASQNVGLLIVTSYGVSKYRCSDDIDEISEHPSGSLTE